MSATQLLLLVFALAVTPSADPVVQAPGESRLQRLVGTWCVTSSTFVNPADTAQATFVAVSAADNRGVYSTWRQGNGGARYEANALWGYDSGSRQVRVFEVNTLGLAALHVGEFDQAGALVLELRDPQANAAVQRRVLTFAGDTLKLVARFLSAGSETPYAATLVRAAGAACR